MLMCVISFALFLFFFFKQKTAYEMRISDWSSDVCSSDLLDLQLAALDVGAQSLFLEVGFLHRPVGEAAQQFGLRPAALVAARPQPDLVGEQLCHAARSEERRVGQEGVSTCRYRWAPDH